MPLICAKSMTTCYGTHPVFEELSVSVDAGEFVGLVGPNGCGKTTLLHCLTGYQPVTSGRIIVAGEALEKLSRRDVARKIAFVPQQTDTVYGFSALEMVMMGRHAFSGFAAADSAEDVSRARAALDELRVAHLAHRPFTQLSGGERQMVLLARALVQQAPAMILDEPLTGLDLRHQFQIMQTLAAFSGSENRGVLATFHDLSIAARWCTRLLLMTGGRIIADGKPQDVITPENLLCVYGIHARVSLTPDRDLVIHIANEEAQAKVRLRMNAQ